MMTFKKIIPLLSLSALLFSAVQAELILEIGAISRIRKDGGNNWDIDAGDDYLVGDSSNNDTLFETAFLIDLSASTSEIASATEINFDAYFDAILGAGQTVSVYVFGKDADTIGNAQTFHDSATTGTLVGAFTPASAPGSFQLDALTAIQSISGTFDNAAFLLTSGLTSNSGGGVADDIRFYAADTPALPSNYPASLTVIPEPNSLILMGVAVLGFVCFRKRK